MPTKDRASGSRKVILFSITVFIAVSGMVSIHQASLQPIPLPQPPEATAEVDLSVYDPARYGIPAMLGPYEVIGVLDASNMSCFPEDQHIIVVQTDEQSVEEHVLGTSTEVIQQELAKVGITIGDTWTLQTMFPSVDKQYFLTEQAKFKEMGIGGNCVRLYDPDPSE